MAQVRIETREIAALERTLSLADHDARKKADTAVRKSAFAIERSAKIRAPVDTAFLRNSISTGFEGDVYSGGLVAEVGPGAHYGGYVELGTWRMAPQPYLGPAYDEVEPSFIEALRAINPLDSGGIGGG